MNTCSFRRLPDSKGISCFWVSLSILALILISGSASAPALAAASGSAAADTSCGGNYCVHLPVLRSPNPCIVGQTMQDPVNDVLPAYIDVTALSSSYSGTSLTATFKIRDVPDKLTFNRMGVLENRLEYSWAVHVDIDNNPNTGYPYDPFRGEEIMISADHFVFQPNSPVVLSIPNGVQVNTWIYDASSGGWKFGTWGTMTVDPQGNTIRLTGTIPGLNDGSRLMFETYDVNPGGSYIRDLGACNYDYAPSSQANEIPAFTNWRLSESGQRQMIGEP